MLGISGLKKGHRILIGPDITIDILRQGASVKIGIKAPRDHAIVHYDQAGKCLSPSPCRPVTSSPCPSPVPLSASVP